jgi:hypothetical protein
MAIVLNNNIKIKNFVDFAFSLTEMDEVKKNGFPIPRDITFSLNKIPHENIQKEVMKQKNIIDGELSDVFEVVIYGINFKFIKNVD